MVRRIPGHPRSGRGIRTCSSTSSSQKTSSAGIYWMTARRRITATAYATTTDRRNSSFGARRAAAGRHPVVSDAIRLGRAHDDHRALRGRWRTSNGPHDHA